MSSSIQPNKEISGTLDNIKKLMLSNYYVINQASHFLKLRFDEKLKKKIMKSSPKQIRNDIIQIIALAIFNEFKTVESDFQRQTDKK